ncbi:MAG: hypothetical protein OCC49_10785 [Fibrobacterales bacterium]
MKYDDFTLEQYLLGDLSKSESVELKSKISNDAELQRRVVLLEQNNHDLRERFPYVAMEGVIRQERAHRKSIHKKRKGVAFVTFAKGILVTLIMAFGVTVTYKSMSPFEGRMTSTTAEVVRIKGLDAQLNVYKKTRLGSSLMRDSMLVSAGDEFQLEYVVTEKCHGVIFSVDGNGVVTHHLAKEDGSSVKLGSLKRLLPFSYQLDDAPSHEIFYMVLSSDSFDVDTYLDVNQNNILNTITQDEIFQVEKIVLVKGEVKSNL